MSSLVLQIRQLRDLSNLRCSRPTRMLAVLKSRQKITYGVPYISPAESTDKPAVAAEGKSPPGMGNIGHITRISNKIIQLGKNNRKIHSKCLQQNREFSDWCTNVLPRRNYVENVYLWTRGHAKFLITK
ncbi:hypothetical protein DVH24_039544 [Malus domestica]|uniref:Uncharacterized protein n=1 Tax=Malus domestica TaxID=3750 RepID=A0A498I908_MALDO|nr:hypothetical protein DVH24_039544 [Malus domestica]